MYCDYNFIEKESLTQVKAYKKQPYRLDIRQFLLYGYKQFLWLSRWGPTLGSHHRDPP